MTVHEVLVAARNRIDRDGWIQLAPGNHQEGPDPSCAINAMDCAGNYSQEREAWREFAKAIGADPDGYLPGTIPDWNDAVGRTKAEVLAAFDRAIAVTAPAPADPFQERDTRAVMV